MTSYQERQFAGEYQIVFWKELVAEGHTTLSLSNFYTFYARARKQLADNTTPKNMQKNEMKPQINRSENNQQEIDEDMQNVASHRPSDLDEIAKQTVDLKALSKLVKRNQNESR